MGKSRGNCGYGITAILFNIVSYCLGAQDISALHISTLFLLLQSTQIDMKDEHYLFCLSLVPKLQRLPPHASHAVQIKILQAIQEAAYPTNVAVFPTQCSLPVSQISL